MIAVIALGLGLIAGSFLNALLYRFGTGRSVARGRSRCMQCGEVLRAHDLVPVLSWAYLRGRCRYCRSRISIQYPLVELAAAMLALWSFWVHAEIFAAVYWFLVHMTLLFVLVYDLRHKIIPWSASILLAALGLVLLITSGADMWRWLSGPLLAAPLLALFLASGGRAMGLGDGALEVGLGWLLGLSMGFSALMLAFWMGAGVGIVLMVKQKGYTMKSELPFAPLLIAGAWIALFFNVDFFATLPALL